MRRSDYEEQVAKLKLPEDTGVCLVFVICACGCLISFVRLLCVGNELGETVVEERRIRIAADPIATAAAADGEPTPSSFYECTRGVLMTDGHTYFHSL